MLQTLAQSSYQEDVNRLYASMGKVASLFNKGSCGPGGCGVDGADEGEEGIDWYEPDPERFYVLDKKSGIELAAVLDDIRNAERYLKRGARAPNRLLFIGAPGNGKTAGALWLGSQLDLPVALIRIDGIVSSLAGKTSKNIRAAFETATSRESLIVIDEFEAVAVSRGESGPNVPQWTKETTSALLQLLDSLPPTQPIIACTNVPETIDKAILRRLRKHVFFEPPDREARAAMVGRWWEKAPHMGGAKKKILDVTEGHSGDFIEKLAEDANRAAARRSESAQITLADVEHAFAAALTALKASEKKSTYLGTQLPVDKAAGSQPPALPAAHVDSTDLQAAAPASP
jgi:SpoVK/Ycf46/Vps4 family AAA+-type ATPase